MSHLGDDVLQQLADGVPAADDARAHLDGCADCQAAVEEYRALFGQLGDIELPVPPPHFTQAVMRDLDARLAIRARQRNLAAGLLAGSAMLAFALFALAGNGAWARQLSGTVGGALHLGRVLAIVFDAMQPVLAAWRLPFVAAMAAVCVPALLALHRSTQPRTEAA